jgi:23S rRNA (uridine2552-2'-O)-methyltransferase
MRQWNDDPFTKKARREEFAARSIYKLEEIDRREKLLKGAKTILDLGAAPGSWTQYCLKTLPQAKVVAVDLSPMEIEHPNLTFLHGPIEEVPLSQAMNGQKADLVLSDMAPKTSGQASRDVALSVELASFALDVAKQHLKLGGHFVVKLFMGEGFEAYRDSLRTCFDKVSLLRPESTRKHSREIFFIAKGFRGVAPASAP